MSIRHIPIFVLLGVACSLCRAEGCANGIPPINPDEAYIVRDDGTVIDIRTKLMWKRCIEGQSPAGSGCSGDGAEYTWLEAMEVARQSTFAGYADWRLPNAKELSTLSELCATHFDRTINERVFPFSEGLNFFSWSSSPVSGNPNMAWASGFYGSPTKYDRTSGLLGARLVRSSD